MARATLEQRVAALEEQVQVLLANHQAKTAPGDLRNLSGAFTGDTVMKQIFEEGRKIRQADRKRAKRPAKKRRQAQS